MVTIADIVDENDENEDEDEENDEEDEEEEEEEEEEDDDEEDEEDDDDDEDEDDEDDDRPPASEGRMSDMPSVFDRPSCAWQSRTPRVLSRVDRCSSAENWQLHPGRARAPDSPPSNPPGFACSRCTGVWSARPARSSTTTAQFNTIPKLRCLISKK